jgi:hypothetical protein
MAVNPDNLRDYSFADIKKAAKQAIITGLLTQNISAGGKTVTFGSVAEARNTYTWAVECENIDNNNSGGFAQIRFK